MERLFDSVLNITSSGTLTLSIRGAVVCTIASIIIGLVIAAIYMMKGDYTKNFVMTLALLPAVVQIVIMIVNGNLGTGVAVMGAFSLVRFRSIPGTAREIASIFLAMAMGLATGTGYIGYAVLFLVIIELVTVILTLLPFGEKKNVTRDLKVTLPEDLDYEGIFDDLFAKYTLEAKLLQVKTTNMGSLLEVRYSLIFKPDINEKEFLDAVRCRNGNLNIVCAREQMNHIETL